MHCSDGTLGMPAWRNALFLAIELAQHIIIVLCSLLGMAAMRTGTTKHVVHTHAAAAVDRARVDRGTGRVGLIRRWGSTIRIIRRVVTLSGVRGHACWRRNVTLLRVTIRVCWRGIRLVAHNRRRGGDRGQICRVRWEAIAVPRICARVIRTMTSPCVRVRRLRSMRTLVMGIIIRKGTLETDSIV